MEIVKFTRLSEDARKPTKGSNDAAGFDLYSTENYTLPARGNGTIKTDICIEILPSDCFGQINGRSSLGKKSIIVGAGVIDRDYRGNINVLLINHSDVDYKISKGDRIAQIVFHKIINPIFIECKELCKTERGERGFGSSGI